MMNQEMSTVNKESLREEAERIQSEFTRLCEDKKINKECRFLIQSMMVLINLLIAIFLEKTTKKTSKNSSIPPSQTEKTNRLIREQMERENPNPSLRQLIHERLKPLSWPR